MTIETESKSDNFRRAPFRLTEFQTLAADWAERVNFFPTIGSTNQEARRYLRSTLPVAPTLWLADQQEAGRGRLGRVWQAPAYSSLLFTLAFRVELPLNQAFLYTSALSLAIQAAAQTVANIRLDLKWPNDLLRDGRKVAGILAELESGLDPAHAQTWLAMGCGLNVNVSAAEFAAAGLGDKATSLLPLEQSFGQKLPSREELLAAILAFWQHYQHRLHTNPQTIRDEWAGRLITIGKEVVVWQNGQIAAAGLASGLDPDGALVIREASGNERSFAAGDVSVRLPSGSYSA